MKNSARRLLAASTATAVAMVGTLAMSTVSAEAATAAAAAKKPTKYGFNGSAYGTFVGVNPLGVKSGTTAYSWLGCTRMPGAQKIGRVAKVNVPTSNPMLQIGAVTSRTASYRRPKTGQVGTISNNKIASVVLGNPKGINLTIKGLETKADAFARKNGKLGAKSSFKSVDISAKTGTPLDDILNPVGAGINDLIKELLKRANNQIKIPGLGRIALGRTSNRVYPKAGYAVSNAVSLRVTLFGLDRVEGGGDDINVIIGRSRARISKNVPSAVMRGSAHAISGNLLDGTANIGPVAEHPLSCEGTRGKIKKTELAGVNLLNQNILGAGVARARVFGVQKKKGAARAWTEGSIANIKLGVGDQALTLKGIVGRANVRQTPKGKIVRSIKGSKVLGINFGGKNYDVPKPGVPLKLGGLLEISVLKRSATPRGLKVIALQVKLLDGSGAVLNLGVANAKLLKK